MPEAPWWIRYRGLRLAVCGVLLLSAAWVAQRLPQAVCTTETTAVAKEGARKETTTKTSCRPLAFADPPVFALLFIVGLLLWPDLSEVSLGVLTLKRKVDEQRAEQEENHRDTLQRLGVIALNLQTIQLHQSQQQSQQQTTNINFPGAETAPLRVSADHALPSSLAARASLTSAGESAEKPGSAGSIAESILNGPAFKAVGLVEAQKVLAEGRLRRVKVAIVGGPTSLSDVLPNVRQISSKMEAGVTEAPDVTVYGDMTASLVAIAAPDSDIFVLPVFRDLSSAGPEALLAAIEEAAVLNPEVLLLAVGSSSGTAPLRSALRRVARGSTLVIAPAGNEGEASASWPAREPEVLAVGAADKTRHRALFSNFGPGVSLFAPGEDVYFLKKERDEPILSEMSGTAASAALVAGAAALLLSRTSLGPDAVRRVLQEAAALHDGGLPLLDVGAAARVALSG